MGTTGSPGPSSLHRDPLHFYGDGPVLMTGNASCADRRAIARGYQSKVRAGDCGGSGCFADVQRHGRTWVCGTTRPPVTQKTGRAFTCERRGQVIRAYKR